MSINGITNMEQYVAAQMAKAKFQNQKNTSASIPTKTGNATKASTQSTKPAAFDDVAGRMANIPNLDQYEALIQRFLSGESELESPNKPLTEDQIVLRVLRREYQRTDTRSLSQMQASMQLANKNFLNYWAASGNTGPMPGRILSADGSFQIFNSKADKDEFMKKYTMNFLKSVMSVIKAGKNNDSVTNGNGLNIMV